MKICRTILFSIMCIFSATSCKKEYPTITFPDPPGITNVTYRVFKVPPALPGYSALESMSPDSFTRKITFLYNWKDSIGVLVPEYRDTIVTGDFLITVSFMPQRVTGDVPANAPGKYHYRLVLAIGWQSVDGKPSTSCMNATVSGVDEVNFGGSGCPTMGRALKQSEYYFTGEDGSFFYDR